MASTSKKYKELDLQEKVELLKFLETHSERTAADKFGVSKTTVNNIKKRKNEINNRAENECLDLSRKRRATEFDEINVLTLNWFKKMRGLNARISGPMLQEIALKFATELKLTHFKASSGWLDSFKKRNQISQKILSGDSNEVDEGTITNFRNRFLEFSAGFSLDNIFNADECGLFYRAMPDRALVMKGDPCKSGKQSKERLTILLAASATGEKLTPLVIGKSKKPRCFKNISSSDLPVLWRANKSAWMTSELFTEWLQIVNKKIKKQRRHILLTIDNCPAHPNVENLTNITLKFLPPNTTSNLQPLDQGIIKNFKAFYRKLLLTNVISKSDMNTVQSVSQVALKINVLDAVLWISEAWGKVTVQTISKCFHKAGFTSRDVQNTNNALDDIEEEILLPSVGSSDMTDFIECDKDAVVWEHLNPSEIFNAVLNEQDSHNTIDNSDDSDYCIEVLPALQDEESSLTPEVVSEMLDKIVNNFAKEKCPQLLITLYQAKSHIADMICQKRQNSVQTTLDSFFTKGKQS